jgi:hypothetical protein
MQTNPNLPKGNLFQQLLLTVEAIGVEKTDQLLKQAQYQEIKFDNSEVEVVVTTIATKFDIPVHEIIYGNGRKNDRKIAIGFCCHYLHEVFRLDMLEVKEHLKKDVTLCWKYAKLIPKLSPRHPSDKVYLEYKVEFDQSLVKK